MSSEKAEPENFPQNEEVVLKEFQDFFVRFVDAEERATELAKRLERLLDNERLTEEISKVTDITTLRERVLACARLNNVEEFSKTLLSALGPIYQLQQKNPALFRGFRRDPRVEFAPLNEMVSYGITGDDLHFHVSDATTLPLSKKLALLKDGLVRLAGVLKNNQDIKVVSATSWIVAEHPDLLMKMGFTIEGAIGENFRREQFEGEARPIHRAVMSRNDFLARYLKNTN